MTVPKHTAALSGSSLHDNPAAPTHPAKARDACPFTDLPLPTQAGILCNDPQFQRFADTRTAQMGNALTAGAAAEYIRLVCGITSRAHLATNTAAAERFAALRTEFDAWRGRIATPR